MLTKKRGSIIFFFLFAILLFLRFQHTNEINDKIVFEDDLVLMLDNSNHMLIRRLTDSQNYIVEMDLLDNVVDFGVTYNELIIIYSDLGIYSYRLTDLFRNEFNKYKIIESSIKMKKIVTGDNFYIMKSQDNKIWGSGDNSNYQLYPLNDDSISSLIEMEIDINIKSIFASNSSCYAIDDKNNLWSWGSNDSGQRGIGTKEEIVRPLELNFEKKIINVSVGRNHALIMDSEGGLWGVGSNGNGQLSIVDKKKSLVPFEILNNLEIENFYSFNDTNLIITKDGKCYYFGKGFYLDAKQFPTTLEICSIESYKLKDIFYKLKVKTKESQKNSENKIIVVSVIDSNINMKYLNKEYIFENNELYDNIDNDGNGFIDDIHGWSFGTSSHIEYDSIQPGHGDVMIEIIIDQIKDKGISSDQIKIIPIEISRKSSGKLTDYLNAVKYSNSMDADIVCCSIGFTQNDEFVGELIEDSKSIFFCASGNFGEDLKEHPYYPASYDFDNIRKIGALNDESIPLKISNYGEDIDIYELGIFIPNSNFEKTQKKYEGTSVATAIAVAKYIEEILIIKNTSN